MAKKRTTVTLDEDILKAVKIRAARQGLRESEVIERALKDAFLVSPLEAIWASLEGHERLTDAEAMELALEAQEWARKQIAKEDEEARHAA